MIENYCNDNNIIDEVEEKPTAETVLKLKLEFEPEERQLAPEEACEEAQRAQEEAQKAHELIELELKAEQEKALSDAEIEAKMLPRANMN